MKSRRKFTKEFKQTAVRRLESGQSIAEVARALEVNPSELHRWRRELQEHGERAFNGVGKKRAEESRVAELERKVGQQAMEIDFLKRALQRNDCGIFANLSSSGEASWENADGYYKHRRPLPRLT
jgi:transposase-like protein